MLQWSNIVRSKPAKENYYLSTYPYLLYLKKSNSVKDACSTTQTLSPHSLLLSSSCHPYMEEIILGAFKRNACIEKRAICSLPENPSA